ncbi:MAG: hypothetical protein RBS87_00870 [Acholeplasma sp.]|jgi:major membrane immunogen (membrane-anchored lipoprotein)|nr:hypothetical protein [Acholeplasma sp.]
MKKILVLLLVVVAAFGLSACQEKEFKVDGEFLAYSLEVSSNKPQVTFVTVTVEKGKIVGYNIDVRQGTRTQNTETQAYSWAWNAKTKKELGDDYGMAEVEGQLEWYEQAALIEAYLLENGVDSLDSTPIGEAFAVDGMAGVTIKNAYTEVAKAAVENAKAGLFTSIYCSGTDFYFATMNVDAKGKVSNLLIDTRQATKDATAGTFVWKDQTKQELGAAYGMKGTGAKNTYANGAWTASTTEKTTLEWNEQIQLILDYVAANGWDGSVDPLADRSGAINGTMVDSLAGVTIKTSGYFHLLDDIFEYAGK